MTIIDTSNDSQRFWLTGTPWREMRLHVRLNPGKGLRVMNTEYHGDTGQPAYWALTPDDKAALLLPLSSSDACPLPAGSRRLTISRIRWGSTRWVLIVCDDQELEDVFLRFCESVLLALDSGSITIEAITTALERYRELFSDSVPAVDRDRVAGLFAELFVLELFLEEGLPAVKAWRGPYGETHDFVFPGGHVEVKSCPASGERHVRISSIYQLSTHENTPLCLIAVPLAPGNRTIAEQYDLARNLTAPEEAQLLDEAMRMAGCADPHDYIWNTRGFETGTPEAWEVRDGFPRLVPDMIVGGIPHGISNVSYSLSLETCGSFSVNVASVAQKAIIQRGQ